MKGQPIILNWKKNWKEKSNSQKDWRQEIKKNKDQIKKNNKS
jgi:hypothetical protein